MYNVREEFRHKHKLPWKLTIDAHLPLASALPLLFSSFVQSKPFLTGPHCHAFIRGPGYMEADVDVHRYGTNEHMHARVQPNAGAFGML